MTKNVNKYESKYSNGKSVSAAQYITEIICENKARIFGDDLHFRFWNSPKWSKFFRDQIASANKLLENYEVIPIIRALKSARGLKIYSLRAPHLKQIIDEETKKYKNLQEKTVNIERIEKPKIQKKENTKNIISILEELDNDN